jgi:hypothetical protein
MTKNRALPGKDALHANNLSGGFPPQEKEYAPVIDSRSSAAMEKKENYYDIVTPKNWLNSIDGLVPDAEDWRGRDLCAKRRITILNC